MTATTAQTGFNAGEIAPELYGQVSLAKYSAAATTMRNAFVNYRGGAMSRGGLATVGVSLQSTYLRLGTSTGPSRPINFQFSNNQGYVLEFGDMYLRFVYRGGYIVESPVSVSGATRANPCTISVTGVPFADGDWVFASGFVGMTQLNGNTYVVANAIGGSFTLQDLSGNAVDSTAYGAYVSGGAFSRLYTIVTPYRAEDLPYLKFSQTADVMSLTCSNPETENEYPPYQLVRRGATDWTLQPDGFSSAIDPPGSVSASAVAIPASGVGASYAYQVTAVDGQGNESIASAIATCAGSDFQVNAGTNTISWSAVPGASYYNIYRAPVSVDDGATPVPVPEGSIFGFVGSSFGVSHTDNNTVPDLAQTPPTHNNPIAPGQVAAVQITGVGTSLGSLSYVVTTSMGDDFSGTPVLNGGTLGAFIVSSHGQQFVPGDSIAFNTYGFSQGAILFGSENPLDGDTITLGGVVWTFVPTLSAGSQTIIGPTLADTLSSLVANLANSGDATITSCQYAVDVLQQNLIVTFALDGAAGDAFTLAASRADVSGATLSGGAGGGADTGAVKAIGDMLFAGLPTAGQTIIVNAITWTFVTSGAIGNQSNLGQSIPSTLKQLAQDLNNAGSGAISSASYGATGARLQIVYDTPGASGNSFTLDGGTSGATPSAATLAGGADASVPTGQMLIGPTSGTYPGVVAYFQQRRFFADSLNQPDTIWASQTGLYANFDTAIPTVATDAITASPFTEQVNGIQWLVAMPGGLIAMTGLRAWQVVGEGSYQLNSQPVTPSTIQAQPQAFNGCSATIPPLVIDYDVLYVQAIGDTTVFDLNWNFYANIYTGNDLTILSSHLFLTRRIVQWAWSRQPYKVLWACCDDGTLISLTYLKEQNVYGWARHDTKGIVVGLCSVTEPPVNAVYAIVQRFPPYATQGIYVMERMDDRVWQSVEDAYAVDSGASNPMATPDSALFASALSGSGVTFFAASSVFSSGDVGSVIRLSGGIATITAYTDGQHVTGTWNLAANPSPTGLPYAPSGAWTLAVPVTGLHAPHLAGMSVVGLADGVAIGPITVAADGGIALPFTASNVKAGLGFTVQLQTPYLNGSDVTQGARKVIPAATVRVAASATFQFGTNQPDGAAQNPPQLGPTWSSMAVANILNPTGGQTAPRTYTTPGGQGVTQLWTGDLRVVGAGASWQSKGQVAIQQSLPLALEVVAVMPEVLPGDIPEVEDKKQDRGQQRGPGTWMLGGAYKGEGAL